MYLENNPYLAKMDLLGEGRVGGVARILISLYSSISLSHDESAIFGWHLILVYQCRQLKQCEKQFFKIN
jgi:hypothetical protein